MVAPPVKNARDAIDGIGFNLGNGAISTDTIGAALGFTCSRWFRVAAEGYQSLATGLQAGLVNSGTPNPNLKVMYLATAYAQNDHGAGDTFAWNTIQQPFILGTALQNLDANGHSTLWAIEGPNEVDASGQGGGTFHVNTTNVVAGPYDGGTNDPDANLCMQEWASAFGSFKAANATQLNSKGHVVEFYSASFSGYYFHPWVAIPLTGVDYGTVHWYAADPPGNLQGSVSLAAHMRAASTSYFNNANTPIVLTEGPIYQPSYIGSDTGNLQGLGRANALAWCDFFASGGHRMFYFELTSDPTNQSGGFGVAFESDGVTKLAFAYILNNINNLLSLGKNYGSTANISDLNNKPAFTPGFNSANVTISGMPGAMVADAGNILILPKSDGSTMIAVWNEANYVGNTSPPATPITVNFGSTQTYAVYDVSGSHGASTMAPATNLTAYASGTASSVTVNTYGMPVFIEIASSPPPTTVPSQITGVTVTGTTATSTTINWPAPTQSPTDYTITITEIT